MSDTLIRAEIPGHHLRFIFCETTQLCELVSQFHKTSGLAQQALYKALSAGVLSSPLLEGEERYTLRWQYAGELGTIMIDVAANGAVRGLPECLKLSLESEELAYGDGGKLGLVKSTPHRRLNSGMTLADRSDPALDLATYFDISDQLPSICRVWQSEQGVRGCLVQGLPGSQRDQLADLEEKLNEVKSQVWSLDLTKDESLSNWVQSWLAMTQMESSELKVHQRLVPRHFCNCSKEKMLDMMLSIPVEEIESMIREDGGAQVDCQFCAKTVRLEASDLQSVLDKKQQ